MSEKGKKKTEVAEVVVFGPTGALKSNELADAAKEDLVIRWRKQARELSVTLPAGDDLTGDQQIAAIEEVKNRCKDQMTDILNGPTSDNIEAMIASPVKYAIKFPKGAVTREQASKASNLFATYVGDPEAAQPGIIEIDTAGKDTVKSQPQPQNPQGGQQNPQGGQQGSNNGGQQGGQQDPGNGGQQGGQQDPNQGQQAPQREPYDWEIPVDKNEIAALFADLK